jgi:2-methylcitrate dehydratase PrpD
MAESDGQALAVALARHLDGIRHDAVPARARDLAIKAIADTVGVGLAGATEACVAILTRLSVDAPASPSSSATLLGQRARVRMLDAPLINGTAAHALDYDDMADAMLGHPSGPIVPVILALGESLGADGRTALEAYVVGFEAECRLGRVVHPHHYERGWHPTATLGVFGAAAAGARMLGLDRDGLATALCIAASMAAGIKSNFGSMVKPLHVGHCARNGLLAALLAQQGYTAKAHALEARQGFFDVFDGLDHVDLSALEAPCGGPLEIERSGFALKQFPCCGSTHASVTAAIRLRAAHAIDPGDIASVSIEVHPRRLPHTDNPTPATGLQAKFSLQYAVARTLVSGVPGLRDFTDEALFEPAVQRVLRVTSATAFAAGEADREMRARVSVCTRAGQRITEEADVLGRSGDDAMSLEELWTKFDDCAARVLSPARRRAAFDGLVGLPRWRNLGELTTLLAADV